METTEQLKDLVKRTYSEIAEQSKEVNASSCCGATACCTVDHALMADDYTNLEGYVPDADLGLGCGLPTEFAHIKAGDTVVDLGSGAGNDAFVARTITGESGKVIGIDFTEKMVERAKENARKLNFSNVEFRQGDIENIQRSLLHTVETTVDQLKGEFGLIPAERKRTLGELTDFVERTAAGGQPVYLNFICTHNSRRSHLSQIWAQTAAYYYGVSDVFCYSGGTEATAFNPRAVKAMREAGFSIIIKREGDSPYMK